MRIEFADPDGWTCGLNNKEMTALLDYVDALEAALNRIINSSDIICTDSCQADIFADIAREALAKGK